MERRLVGFFYQEIAIRLEMRRGRGLIRQV